MLEHGIDGTLDQVEAEWDRRIALGVVLAAANYPDTPQKGDVISGLPKADSFGDDCHVSTPAPPDQDGQVVTNGGRVLCVTALGENVKLAQKRAYEAARPDCLGRHAVPQGHWLPRHQSLTLFRPSDTQTGALILPMSRPFHIPGDKWTPPASRPTSPACRSRIVSELEAFDGQSFRTDSLGIARKAAAACRG